MNDAIHYDKKIVGTESGLQVPVADLRDVIQALIIQMRLND